MAKRTKRVAEPRRSQKPPKEAQPHLPGIEPPPKESTPTLANVAAIGEAMAKHMVEAAARRVLEEFTWGRDTTKRSWVSTRSGRLNTRHEYVIGAAELRDLVTEAASVGFVLALDRFAPDILKNEEVREKFKSGPQKSAAVRLKAKLARRAEIEAHIAAAESRGEQLSVAQACDQLGISRSTGYDAMNHGQ